MDLVRKLLAFVCVCIKNRKLKKKDYKKKENKVHPADRDGYDPFTCDVDVDEKSVEKDNDRLLKKLGWKK